MGALKGPTTHRTKQKHTVKLSKEYGFKMTRTIIHDDRERVECSKKILIDSQIVYSWVSSEAPAWESQKRWSKYTNDKKISSYVDTFDEGYGVSFEYVQ